MRGGCSWLEMKGCIQSSNLIDNIIVTREQPPHSRFATHPTRNITASGEFSVGSDVADLYYSSPVDPQLILANLLVQMASIDGALAAGPSTGGIEWQNTLRTRLMAKQAESEAYREIVDQCGSPYCFDPHELMGQIEDWPRLLESCRSETERCYVGGLDHLPMPTGELVERVLSHIDAQIFTPSRPPRRAGHDITQ